MTRRAAYIALLTLSLSAVFVASNPSVSETGQGVSPYPSLFSLLVVPAVLGLLLWDYARQGHGATEVRREGRVVAFWAGAAFALAVATFSLGVSWHAEVGRHSFAGPAFGATVAFAWTYLLGAGTASSWGRVFRKSEAR